MRALFVLLCTACGLKGPPLPPLSRPLAAPLTPAALDKEAADADRANP
jgi:hypothetical protein